MKRIGREQHAVQAQLADQHLRRRNLVRCGGNLVMREGQSGIGGEGAQDVSGGLVMQVVETAPQGLPIQGDHAQALPSSPVIQTTSMTTEGSLEVGWIERQDEVAQGIKRRRAAEAGSGGSGLRRSGSGAHGAG
jgi:hypothetical protein